MQASPFSGMLRFTGMSLSLPMMSFALPVLFCILLEFVFLTICYTAAHIMSICWPERPSYLFFRSPFPGLMQQPMCFPFPGLMQQTMCLANEPALVPMQQGRDSR